MVDRSNTEAKRCKGLCQFMFPVLVILLLLFAAYYLVEEAKVREDKRYVVLTQHGEEILRVSLEDSKLDSREIPIVYKGESLGLFLEIRGHSARILASSKGKPRMGYLPDSAWIHEKEDVYVFEPYELKLYFE